MGRAEVAYSPIAYHNGSVWPHDTSIAAAGLGRYGFRSEAAALCEALQRYDRQLVLELIDKRLLAILVPIPCVLLFRAWARPLGDDSLSLHPSPAAAGLVHRTS